MVELVTLAWKFAFGVVGVVGAVAACVGGIAAVVWIGAWVWGRVEE